MLITNFPPLLALFHPPRSFLLLLHNLFVGLDALPLPAIEALLHYLFLHPLPLLLLLDQLLGGAAAATLPASQVLSRGFI